MPTERIEVPQATTSPAVARRFVSGVLGDDPRCADVVLLVSELVTNAVQHASSSAEVTVDVNRGRIRVEVADGSTTPAAIREPTITGGRGLRMVDAVADRWGVRERRGGKVVWFELDGARR